MHVPTAFREDDPNILRQIMSGAGLAQFVTATAEGPVATPLPLFLDPDEGPFGVLYGHMARANPQWEQPLLGPALAIFMGDDAYVTPSWYASKPQHGKVVPTWNYESVQAFGIPEFFQEADRLLAVVTRLTDRHEQARAEPWRVSDAPADFLQSLLTGIVGFRMPIDRLAGKRKMSQNRSLEDRAGVAAGLGASAQPMDQRVSAIVRRPGDRREDARPSRGEKGDRGHDPRPVE
jgi:transcriptional regulator